MCSWGGGGGGGAGQYLFCDGVPQEKLLVFRAQGCGLKAAGWNSFCQLLLMSHLHVLSHHPVHQSPSFHAITIQSIRGYMSYMHVICYPTAGQMHQAVTNCHCLSKCPLCCSMASTPAAMGVGPRVLGMGVQAPTMACSIRWIKRNGSPGKLLARDSRWWMSTYSMVSQPFVIVLSKQQVPTPDSAYVMA